LYVLDVDEGIRGRCQIEAWDPSVPGIAEVFHATISDWAYPPHCHSTWAILLVDEGVIRYDLDRRRCGAHPNSVSILPPGVVHDGRPAPGAQSFRKRELYLDQEFLPSALIGPAVQRTNIEDPGLSAAIGGLHDSLLAREGHVDAEARLTLIAERIIAHLRASQPAVRAPETRIAGALRELLDANLARPTTLQAAAAGLDRSVPHLVRSFTRHFGVSPHAYVTGRRVDAARRLLLQGASPAEAAIAVGFFDQAHLNRHFKRYTSQTPARFTAA